MKKNIMIFSVLILTVIFMPHTAFCEENSRPAGLSEKVSVRIARAKKEDLRLVLSYVGTLKAKDEAEVYPKTGGKLTQYLLNEGDPVRKGEVIALIERDETGLKYEPLKVESPIEGIIGKVFLDKGTNVLITSAIALVLNMEEMIIRLNIPERDVAHFKKGLKAEAQFDSYPKDIFSGVVSRVSEVLDTATRTLPIEITIPNNGHRLKSGMFARIKLVVAERPGALTVAHDALIQELGADYVFVTEEAVARKKKVSLGVQEDSVIEILEGIKEGDYVIIFGQQGLKDGANVEISEDIK